MLLTGCSVASLIVMQIDEATRTTLVKLAASLRAPHPEDAVHDVIVRVLANPKSLHNQAAYLATAVRREAISQHRTYGRHRTSPMSDYPRTAYRDYPMAMVPATPRTPTEDYLVSAIDLAAWIDRNYPIPGHGGVLGPLDPTKEISDRKELETVTGTNRY